MDSKTIQRIKNLLADLELSYSGSPLESIQQAETSLGVSFDKDYIEFLHLFGSVYAGISIYGVERSEHSGDLTVMSLTSRYRSQGYPVAEGEYVFSFDASDNPIIQNASGTVSLFDHDNGENELAANSFESLLLKYL